MFEPKDLDKQIIIDAKLRSQKMNDWRLWFTENMQSN
jgi:hypothetical protein